MKQNPGNVFKLNSWDKNVKLHKMDTSRVFREKLNLKC